MRIFLLLLLSLPFFSYGLVDTKSAGYSKTFVDFSFKGLGFDLKIDRAYNSRSLYNGFFGFGWCSNFETRLTVLPDNSIKSTECGGGMEIFYHPKNKKADVNLQVNLILKQIQKRKVKMKNKSLKKLRQDLLQSQTLRADFIGALDIKGKATDGTTYFANGRFNEFVIFKNGRFYRTLPSGASEVFNSKGQITRTFDKFGSSLDVAWRSDKVIITNNKGRRITLLLDQNSGKVKQANFGKKVVARYKYNGKEDLTYVKNSYNEEFLYAYDSLHNLTTITYPDKTTEKLAYNKNKDWVISFTNRKNCLENYTYGKNPKNSDHYFSKVIKTCGRKITNRSTYEFWNRSGSGKSGKYLHRARARVNGRLTDVIYHPQFGTPVSFLKDGIRTNRKYYKNGLLKEKSNPYRVVEYKKYSQLCRKPELVNVGYKNKKSGKIIKKERIVFTFKKDCQLQMARKSKDEWIKVAHDSKGRLVKMEDQSRKIVSLSWSDKFNKPEVITRKGVGSIRIIYTKDGQIANIKGSSGPSVLTQVSSVFNSFLQTLSPVAEEMVIL